MTPRTRIAAKRQEGLALVVTVFVLLLIGGFAIAAIGQSGQEAASSARTRASIRARLAADAGVEVAIAHLAVSDDSPFDLDIGDGIRVQSRARDDAAPQGIKLASPGGPPPDEYGLPSAAGTTYGETGFFTDVYLINATSSLPDGSVAQVEARVGRLSTGG